MSSMIGSTSWVVPGTYAENARALEGIVDIVELLVYTWDVSTRSLLDSECDDLLRRSLQYSVHLPTDTIEHCVQAVRYFEDRRFPVLNYVLHPLDGWREYQWNERVAVENLMDKLDPYDRMVFDIGHHLLGQPFPEQLEHTIVEIHAMGVVDGIDHSPLDEATLDLLTPYIGPDVPVVFEVFELDGLKHSLDVWKSAVH